MAVSRPWLAPTVLLSLASWQSLACSSLALFIAVSCGTNQLKPRAPSSPVEEAELLLEAGKYAEARAVLEPYMLEHGDDYRARALLAASHAAEAGVNLYALVESTLSDPKKSEQDLIAPLVPDATESNIASVRLARDVIISIPEESRTADIKLGATVYSAIYALLLVKQLTVTDNPPTVAQALEVLESLDQAADLAVANGVPADQIDAVREKIAAQPGETDAQRLAAYIEQLKAESVGTYPLITPSDHFSLDPLSFSRFDRHGGPLSH